jgi:hypothetical protein
MSFWQRFFGSKEKKNKTEKATDTPASGGPSVKEDRSIFGKDREKNLYSYDHLSFNLSADDSGTVRSRETVPSSQAKIMQHVLGILSSKRYAIPSREFTLHVFIKRGERFGYARFNSEELVKIDLAV